MHILTAGVGSQAVARLAGSATRLAGSAGRLAGSAGCLAGCALGLVDSRA